MKKLLSFALLTLSVGLWAETAKVSYVYPVYNTEGDPVSGIKEWKTGEVEATIVESATEYVKWGIYGKTTWYVVQGEITLSKGVICNDNVHLILADGAKLRADGQFFGEATEMDKPAIEVDMGSLTIYGQTAQSGQLNAYCVSNFYAAGIGGAYNTSGSNITINGGKIRAVGGDYAAGIGGGGNGTFGANGTNITINGGTVEAIGGWQAAGIGGGSGGSAYNITINGGTVTASGGSFASGIGGGAGGTASNITIKGGKIIATGGNNNAAGIGSGDEGDAASDIFVATNLVVKAGTSTPLTVDNIVAHTSTDDIADDLAGKQYATVETPVEKITLSAADFTVTKDGDWTYDQTEKRINVEFISVENPGPPADKVEIYYNNDKTVKPIEPGTYQVYIDIRETDIYAAVTGITSDAWKFDIIDREGAIQAIKDKKEEARQAIDSEAGDFETVPIVQKVVEDAKVDFENVTITAINTINEATDQSTITTTKDNAISEIDKIEESAKTDIQTAIDDFKGSVKNEIDNAATDTKSKIDAFAVSDKVKYDAISEINKAVAEAEGTIDNANSKEQIDNAKNKALNEFSKQLAIVEASYAQLQATKESAIQKIEEVAADAVAAIDEAAGEYASLQAIREIISSKKEEIVSRKGEASHFIGDATDMEKILEQKEEAIQHIENIKSSAVEKIQEAIADYKQKTIVEIKDVATSAKEEIDGLGVDESAKSEAKAQIDNIANMAEQTINAATSKDAIDNAKTQAIADIHNVVQTTKDMWITLRTNVTANDWNTICMERNITAIDGATFWNVVSETSTEFILEQITEPQAGYGYIIRYTATELKVKYEGDAVINPVTATQDHPIQGNFAEITCDEHGDNELVGNYVVYQNKLCMVTGWVTMADHRAYVIPNIAPSKAPAPNGAPRMTMAKPNSTPTEFGTLPYEGKARKGSFKVIENGQFRIVRDNKMYNAQGIEL